MVEEEDMRIIPHVMQSIMRGNKRSVVLANDTDVVILMLCYAKLFLTAGAQEIWIRIGIQDRQRLIPINTLNAKLGATFCRVLRGRSSEHLREFGEDSNPSDDILLLKSRNICPTFDQLRFMKYRSNVSVSELPPSSYCMQNGQ